MRISDWSSDVCSSDLREKAKWLPIRGDDWFFVANAVSDTVLEPRTFPIPVGVQTTERPGSLDVFGKDAIVVFSPTFIGGLAQIGRAWLRERVVHTVCIWVGAVVFKQKPASHN